MQHVQHVQRIWGETIQTTSYSLPLVIFSQSRSLIFVMQYMQCYIHLFAIEAFLLLLFCLVITCYVASADIYINISPTI